MWLSGIQNFKNVSIPFPQVHHVYLKSEQQLVDCIGFTKGRGCGGGFAEWAYDYLISGVGPETSAAYPYNFVSTFLLGQFVRLLSSFVFVLTF